jgi:hypothetical protein
MSSTRHWNLKRHISRRHGGIGEPLAHGSKFLYRVNTQATPYFYGSLFSPVQKLDDQLFTNKFLDQNLTLLRKLVEYKNLLGQLRNTSQQLNVANFNYDMTPPVISNSTEPENRIIGYEGFVCSECLTYQIKEVYSGDSYIAIKNNHQCIYDRKLKFKSVTDLSDEIEQLNQNLVASLVSKVNDWIGTERYDEMYVYSLEFPSDISHFFSPEYKRLLKQYEITPVVEDCVRLDAVDQDHWSYRAIKDGMTIINQNELKDFLIRAKATISIFEVFIEGHTRHFLMAISRGREMF